MINKNSKIYIPGHNGLVGKAIHGLLMEKGYKKILFEKRKKLDLRDEKKVDFFF